MVSIVSKDRLMHLKLGNWSSATLCGLRAQTGDVAANAANVVCHECLDIARNAIENSAWHINVNLRTMHTLITTLSEGQYSDLQYTVDGVVDSLEQALVHCKEILEFGKCSDSEEVE